ncbi:MAG: hypothetical protein HKM06_00990 [Spirochaetales bacterium]|nr:hypothetical protein [Spirochaetales bacterium]
MSSLARLSIALLFSTLVFTAFALVAFTGLFPWIEAQFYFPRVVTHLQNRLESQESGLLEWEKSVEKKIQAFVDTKVLNGVFDPTQSRLKIKQRYQTTKLFLQGFQSGAILRVSDASLSELHFSSSDEDILRQGQLSLTYKRVTDLTDAAILMTLKKDSPSAQKQLLWDNKSHSFVFVWPWRDPESDISGLLLLTLSLEDAQNYLFQKDLLGFHETFLMAGWGLPLFFDSGPQDPSLEARVQTLSSRGVWPPVQKLAQSSEGATWMLITARQHSGSIFGKPAVLVLQNRLELSLGLKVIILASFYTVCFLLIFLILNGRADPVSNVSQKVKRFQIQVLKQYLDQKEKEKTLELRKTLLRHSDQIKLDILKSLGKVRPKDESWVRDYISRSWSEILTLLGGNEGTTPDDTPQKTAELDWNKLEAVLERVISRVGLKLQPSSAESQKQGKQDSIQRFNLQTKEKLEEEVEELEELEELEEEEKNPGSADRSEQTEEFEEAESLEELDEAEELEELEEAESVEDVEEAEEITEGEEGDPGEERATSAAVEELEELEDADEEPLTDPGFQPVSASGSSDAQKYSPSASFLPDNDSLRLHQNEELEELEADSSGLADLEELPQQDGSLELLGKVDGHDGSSFSMNSTLTEVLEPDEEAEDLEELLSLEEGENQEGDSPKNGPPERMFIPLEELDRAWGTGDDQVFEESGDLVRLSDQVFQSVQEPQDEFGRLVGGVLHKDSPVLVEEFIPQREYWPWVWTGGGFDLERFFGPQKQDVSRVFRGLNELTSDFGAFSCALIESEDGVWKATASVGFSDQGKLRLNFVPSSSLAKDCLEKRGVHVLDGTPGHNRLIWESFHAKDVRYLGAVVLLPGLRNSQLVWLLLGYKTYPQNLLDHLKPRILQ